MKVYVDFDDVICETARDLSALAERLYAIRVPYPAIRAFDLHEAFGLDDAQYRRLMAVAHSREFVLGYAETPGAAATLNRWADAGIDVEIVTGRPFITAASSRDWLAAHGLARLPVVHVDKYGREPPAAPGAPRALTLAEFAARHYDFAVEDSPAAFQFFGHLPDLQVLVYDRPWNRACEFPSGNFRRCADWETINNIVQSNDIEKQK